MRRTSANTPTRLAIVLSLLIATGATTRASAQLPQREPVVRIGLDQNAETVAIRSAEPVVIEGMRTLSARLSVVLAVDPKAATLRKADLQYRTVVELDEGNLIVVPSSQKLRIDPSGSPLSFDNKSYRGAIEVFGNSRGTLTVVNELPLEEYLFGVVPNELGPRTFGEIEALKAQTVAARTYIIKNLGQYRREGFDICDTDACQVYNGFGTEDPLSSRAVTETRGLVATFDGKPINALYSSTCGGSTENAENIFEEKTPYLVSTICAYKHPEPLAFEMNSSAKDWQTAVLQVAGVTTYKDAQAFLGLTTRVDPPAGGPAALAAFLRKTFYPEVRVDSDLTFMVEQGVLSQLRSLSTAEVLFRLIERKNAIELQQGTIIAWDGQKLTLNMAGQIREFELPRDALVFERFGDERIPRKSGAFVGGEYIDFRAEDGRVVLLAYRASPSTGEFADRYSRLASWQVYKSKQELDTAFRTLGIGTLTNFRVLGRGKSDRAVETEVSGTSGRRTLRALRVRTLLGLRDSLFHFDVVRNRAGELIGITFFGKGWGHGVGMCQVGAYGMARDGATAEDILKKYYHGIELKQLY